jgi:cytochrome c biogenesis factor
MNVPLTAAPGPESVPGGEYSALSLAVAVAVLVPVCFWVYNDARMRYNNRTAPALWAVSVFAALIVFLPLYFVLRPRRRPQGPDR